MASPDPLDPQARLLAARIVVLGSTIDDQAANTAAASLLFLQQQDPTAPIHLYINSSGGTVAASLAIHDTIQFVKAEVRTYGIGQVTGTALLLLASGEKGQRFVLPHARGSFGDVFSARSDGSAKDREIAADELARLRTVLIELFHRYAGLSKERIESELGAGRIFDAETTVQLGLADRVIDKQDLPD